MELQVPSIRQSLIAGMVYAARWCFSTNPESMNESEGPESTRDISSVSGIDSEVAGIMRVSGVVMITMDFGISPGCYQVEGVKTLNYSGNSVVK